MYWLYDLAAFISFMVYDKLMIPSEVTSYSAKNSSQAAVLTVTLCTLFERQATDNEHSILLCTSKYYRICHGIDTQAHTCTFVCGKKGGIVWEMSNSELTLI